MEKHTPEKRRKERIEEVMLEVCIDNSSDYVERTLLIRNGLLIDLTGIGGRNIMYILLTKRELACSIKDLFYGIKSTEKNDLRTCLFSNH